jgi:hypothetical protein
MLGVESGASVFDFDGTLQKKVEDHVAAHPAATFEEVHRELLAPYEGLIRQNQISPRCYEAAALRTAMILYEGEYSGVLKPGRHFFPLRKDFSNFAEVLAFLRDPVRMQAMVDCAYEEVALNPEYSYRRFIERFDQAVDDEVRRRGLAAPARRYSRGRYLAQMAQSPAFVAHRLYSRTFQWLLLGTPLRRVVFTIWGMVPRNVRQFVRPFLRLIGR